MWLLCPLLHPQPCRDVLAIKTGDGSAACDASVGLQRVSQSMEEQDDFKQPTVRQAAAWAPPPSQRRAAAR